MIAPGTINKNLFALLGGIFILSVATAIYTEQYAWVALPFAIIVFYAGWQKPNLVFLLLLFSLPFSFEYSFSPGLGTDIPDEFLMLFTAFLFLAGLCYAPGSLEKPVRQHPLLFLLLAWLCWIMITVVFSTQPLISLKYLLAKTWYIAAFVLAPLLIFRTKKSLVIAFVALVSAMMLVVLISLYRHEALGFRFASVNEAIFPFFRNHVNYSAMLVCLLPVLVACLKLSTTRTQKLIATVCITIALAALFFAYARGAWLALLSGIVAVWLLKRKFLFVTYLLAIGVVTASLFWIKSGDRYLRYAPDFKTTIFHKDFNEHLVATYQLKDVSTAERFYRWIAGIRMIKDGALTGYGPNTFYDNYKPYAVPAYKTWVSDNKDHSTVHNYFLLVAIEQGIPGLIIFLLLLGALFYYAQRSYHRSTDIFYRTVAMTIGTILVILVVLNFLSDLVETDKIGSIFFLCISVLIVAETKGRILDT